MRPTVRPPLVAALTALALVALAAPAGAVVKFVKHDALPQDIEDAASQISGTTGGYFGFGKGEAIGQVYRAGVDFQPAEYPVNILELHLFFGSGDPGDPLADVQGTFEFYYSDSAGPDPGKGPDFTIETGDLLRGGAGGAGQLVTLSGSTAIQITFDQTDPENHPPPVPANKNVWVMFRYGNAGQFFQGCSQLAAPCGCQPVGPVNFDSPKADSNVLHYYNPLGGCEQAATSWIFFEDAGLDTNLLWRMKVETSGTGCAPSCTGKQCGSDGCGGSCGSCSVGEFCSQGLCTTGTPCTPACSGRECGDDGCGGVCGICTAPEVCQAGLCTDGSVPCTPQCAGATCGPDGCGGSCGSCGAGETCLAGACGLPPTGGAFKVTSISPRSGYNDGTTDVSIVGAGFQPGLEARIGARGLGVVSLVGDSLLEAIVPEGLEEGTYDLILVNPDETTAVLPQAYEVKVRGKSKGGCAGAPDGAPWALLALAGLAVAVLRRRA